MKKRVSALMRVDVDIVDATGVEGRRAALDAVHDVAFIEKETREKRSILTGDAGDQRDLVAHSVRSALMFGCWTFLEGSTLSRYQR